MPGRGIFDCDIHSANVLDLRLVGVPIDLIEIRGYINTVL